MAARAPYPKRPFSSRELLYSVGSLVVIAIVIQMMYATIVRPRAEVLLAAANRVDASGNSDRGHL